RRNWSLRPGIGVKGIKCEAQVGRRLKPLCRTLLEAVFDEARKGGGNVPFRDRQLGRIFIDGGTDDVGGRGTRERALTREHLVQDRAKREDIRAVLHSLPAQLLWTPVAQRAAPHP